MSSKTLFVNGCSMTYGSELYDDPITKKCIDNDARFKACWAGVLGKKINCNKVVNHAYPGGSNDRILRTTIAWLIERFSKKSYSNNELFVIIGWTSPMRREFYIDDEWRQLIPHHDYLDTSASVLNRIYREIAWSEHESAIRFATQVVTLQSFLQLYQISYLFFDAITSFSETNESVNNRLAIYESHITENNYFCFGKIHGSMASILKTNKKNNSRHPNIDEHEKWANILKEYIDLNGLWSSGNVSPQHDQSIIYEGTKSVPYRDKKIGLPNMPREKNIFGRLNAINDLSPSKSKRNLFSLLKRAKSKDPFIYE